MPPQADEQTERIPIYTYTLTLKDGTTRTATAWGYELDGPWLIFDDANGSVLTIREELVSEAARGEQVGEQEVDAL
ncbi:MAG: hypothetical protein ACRDRN_10390 [Sciscionella sp.]